jgi:hypothetical protein
MPLSLVGGNFTVKMAAVCSPEVFIITYKITWHRNPEDPTMCRFTSMKTLLFMTNIFELHFASEIYIYIILHMWSLFFFLSMRLLPHCRPGVGNLFMLEGRINLAVIK